MRGSFFVHFLHTNSQKEAGKNGKRFCKGAIRKKRKLHCGMQHELRTLG